MMCLDPSYNQYHPWWWDSAPYGIDGLNRLHTTGTTQCQQFHTTYIATYPNNWSKKECYCYDSTSHCEIQRFYWEGDALGGVASNPLAVLENGGVPATA